MGQDHQDKPNPLVGLHGTVGGLGSGGAAIGAAHGGISDGLGWMLHKGVAGLDRAAGAGFWLGDEILHHGGQIALDAAGFVPGVNVLTEGLQSGYHALHAGYDLAHGRNGNAFSESVESAWHLGNSALNLFTVEGGAAARGAEAGARGVVEAGEAAHGAATAAKAGEAAAHGASEDAGFFHRVFERGEHLRDSLQEKARIGRELPAITSKNVHTAHTALDAKELMWDTGATVVQQASGKPEGAPFLGGLVPWLAKAVLHGGLSTEEHDD